MEAVRAAAGSSQGNAGHLSPTADSPQTFASHDPHCPPWRPTALLEFRGFGSSPAGVTLLFSHMRPRHAGCAHQHGPWTELAGRSPAHSSRAAAHFCLSLGRSCRGPWMGTVSCSCLPDMARGPARPRADGDPEPGDTQRNVHARRHTHAHPILTQDASLASQTTPCISRWPLPRDLLALSCDRHGSPTNRHCVCSQVTDEGTEAQERQVWSQDHAARIWEGRGTHRTVMPGLPSPSQSLWEDALGGC